MKTAEEFLNEWDYSKRSNCMAMMKGYAEEVAKAVLAQAAEISSYNCDYRLADQVAQLDVKQFIK